MRRLAPTEGDLRIHDADDQRAMPGVRADSDLGTRGESESRHARNKTTSSINANYRSLGIGCQI
jgi:hypothetical protein